MQAIADPQSKIDQKEFAEFLEWKKFRSMQERSAIGELTSSTLTNPPLVVHNPLCVRKQQEEGLCMVGSVRAKGKCKNCGGKFINSGKALGCPKCFITPEKYIVDYHYKGKRYRLFKDKSGEILDSYNRAKRLIERIRGEIDEGSHDPTFYVQTDKRKFQFDQYIWTWFDLIKDNLAPSTTLLREKIIKKHYIPFFTNQDIREIRSGDIVKFLKKLRNKKSNNDEKLSSGYIKTIIITLHKVFSDAYSWEDIIKIPVFPKIQVIVKPFKWIDRKTQELILNETDPRHHPIFNFLFLTGCRICEATALKWDCVNLKENTLLFKRTHSAGKLKETTKVNGLAATSPY